MKFNCLSLILHLLFFITLRITEAIAKKIIKISHEHKNMNSDEDLPILLEKISNFKNEKKKLSFEIDEQMKTLKFKNNKLKFKNFKKLTGKKTNKYDVDNSYEIQDNINNPELFNEFIYKEKNYSSIVQLINNKIQVEPELRYAAYNRVAYLVDTFGPRLWGSEALLDASKFLRDELNKENFEEVKMEPIPNSLKWVRGNESLTMLSPRKMPTIIPIIGMGKSIGGDVTAELIVFDNLESLNNKSKNVQGKLILLNFKWTNYFKISNLVYKGVNLACKFGAAGLLIRSKSPTTSGSPHTGAINYNNQYQKIPVAAITVEDSEMFSRMQNRGQKIILRLKMDAHFDKPTTTYNVMGQITGTQFPDEIVIIGGHIDSWDTGTQTGANDDAAGFMVCMEAVRILIKLNLRPKRTIRFVAWSGEEFGERNSGGPYYAKIHKKELNNYLIGFESDLGITDILGWGYSGGAKGFEILKIINKYYLEKEFNLKEIIKGDGISEDVRPLFNKGIPVIRNIVEDTSDNEIYFTTHHSAQDSVSILDKDDMDKNVAAIASLFYIIGDLSIRFPRD